ncbi:MAG: LysM peptidoglycan-binding domain-containing protein [Saprospiraceae bacterium]
MKTILILFFSLFFTFISKATGDSLNYLLPQDTVFLEINHRGQKIFRHTIEKGQTLYSLALFYGMDIHRLWDYNPNFKEKGTSRIGDKIVVPIPNKCIHRISEKIANRVEFSPVCYLVKPGDTMYNLAKRNFKMDTSLIRQYNALSNNSLDVGQLLHIGWMKADSIPQSWQSPTSYDSENKQNYIKFLDKAYSKMTITGQGKAEWDKSDSDDSGLVCLHSIAPRGSIIKLINPVRQRTIYARVVGRLPSNYEEYVVVKISKQTAKALGAIDEQFFIKVEHFIE